MYIEKGLHISITRKGEVYSNIYGGWGPITDAEDKAKLLFTYRIFRKRSALPSIKDRAINSCIDFFEKKYVKHPEAKEADEQATTQQEVEDKEKILEKKKEKCVEGIGKLMKFMSEFSFEPNFRFVNTLNKEAVNSKADAINYINNYFRLTDNSFADDVKEKMKSSEFDSIISLISEYKSEKSVNSRLKIYYGSQGTGKTTRAMNESSGRCMVCHSAMLPSDLMEDFKFEDGKATFIPSALQNAMTNGDVIVLDEINLLPFESLRFLQSILDGKKEFLYKGKTINIKDGFKVIGTMNLVVNGCTYALPEPLVDRCESIKEFKLTAEMLSKAIF